MATSEENEQAGPRKRKLLFGYACLLTAVLLAAAFQGREPWWMKIVETVFWVWFPLGIYWCSLNTDRFLWFWRVVAVYGWIVTGSFGLGFYLMVVTGASGGVPPQIRSAMLYESYLPGFLVMIPAVLILSIHSFRGRKETVGVPFERL